MFRNYRVKNKILLLKFDANANGESIIFAIKSLIAVKKSKLKFVVEWHNDRFKD